MTVCFAKLVTAGEEHDVGRIGGLPLVSALVPHHESLDSTCRLAVEKFLTHSQESLRFGPCFFPEPGFQGDRHVTPTDLLGERAIAFPPFPLPPAVYHNRVDLGRSSISRVVAACKIENWKLYLELDLM